MNILIVYLLFDPLFVLLTLLNFLLRVNCDVCQIAEIYKNGATDNKFEQLKYPKIFNFKIHLKWKRSLLMNG